MKHHSSDHVLFIRTARTLALLALVTALSHQLAATPLGTAFTYKGNLATGGSPANGNYDIKFTLYGIASGGTAVAGPLTNSLVGVTNGVFYTTLDFGAGAFDGNTRWIELAVRTNGIGAFATLSPRQPVEPLPYALFSPNAGAVAGTNITGTIPLAHLPSAVVTNNQASVNLSGAFTGSGAGLTSVNAATLQGLAASGFWSASGNAGTTPGLNYLGTSDNQALELKVNGQRALRLEPNINGPSLIGGAANNSNATYASVIGGGWQNAIQTDAYYAAIGGGRNNTIKSDAHDATISGGYGNSIQDSGVWATIGGGYSNTIALSTSFSTIAGGALNIIQGGSDDSSIGGGVLNAIESADNATIAGGGHNTILSGGVYASISGGYANTNGGIHAGIGGGYINMIQTYANYTTIGGGRRNTIETGSFYSTVAGGTENTAQGDYSAIPGGFQNETLGDYSVAAGRQAKANHPGAFVWADSTAADFASTGANQFLVRAGGGVGVNTNDPAGAALNVAGTARATTFEGGGAGLTTLDASNLASGTVPLARLPGEVVTNHETAVTLGGTFNGNGAGLTNLNASNLASGTVPLLRLPTGILTNGEAGVTLGGTFSGNGTSLTNLNASNLASGTVPLPRLPGEVVTNNETAVTLGGTFSGNGFGLTNLNASNLVGTVASARLPTAVVTNTETGLTLGGTFSGNGPGLTNLNASNLASGTVPLPRLPGEVVTNNETAVTLGGTFSGTGSGLTSLNAASLASGTVPDARLSNNVARLNASATFSNMVQALGDLRGYRLAVGTNHVLTGSLATIAGGMNNTNQAPWATIGGGLQNTIDEDALWSTIGGGQRNIILQNAADAGMQRGVTIAGGDFNRIGTNSPWSTIGGGSGNRVVGNAESSTIAGGEQNTISTMGISATIGGGFNNSIEDGAFLATIPGGENNIAGGTASFAAGHYAEAAYDGSFVWGDYSTNSYVTSGAANSWTVRASGGVRFFSNSGLTAGVYLAPGGGSWTSVSDRAAKENMQLVSPGEVLAKVTALPMATWNYKSQDASIRHIGPMAQDFKAAFAVGESDTGISTVDADGVALAAIQGLNRKVEAENAALRSALRARDAELEALKQRLEALETRFGRTDTK